MYYANMLNKDGGHSDHQHVSILTVGMLAFSSTSCCVSVQPHISASIAGDSCYYVDPARMKDLILVVYPLHYNHQQPKPTPHTEVTPCCMLTDGPFLLVIPKEIDVVIKGNRLPFPVKLISSSKCHFNGYSKCVFKQSIFLYRPL